MNCKKIANEKCRCLRRKHDGCADCEKKAMDAVRKSGRNLNETIKFVKETGDMTPDLYVAVDEFACFFECRPSFAFRSAIDILRGVCKYCRRGYSKACLDCMWSHEGLGEDFWLFDEDILAEV